MIEKLASRYTVIRQVNGRKLVIPNVTFNKTPIQTYMREDVVRGEVLFTVEHHIPIDQLQKLIKRAVNTHPNIEQKEKTSIIPALVDGAGTTFTVYFFMNPKTSPPMFKVASDVRVIIMKTLNTYHITVPYPKKVLDFAPDTEVLSPAKQ